MPRAGSRFSPMPTRSALASLTSPVHGSRRAVVQRLMQALLVVKRKVALQAPLQLPYVLVPVQIDVFILHRPPQALDKDVVQTSLPTIHAHPHASRLQPAGEGLR